MFTLCFLTSAPSWQQKNGICNIDNVRVFLGNFNNSQDKQSPTFDVEASVPISQLYGDDELGSLSAICVFVEALGNRIASCFSPNKRDLYLTCATDPAALTKACFYIGTFMILVQNHDQESLCQTFSALISLKILNSEIIGKIGHESTMALSHF